MGCQQAEEKDPDDYFQVVDSVGRTVDVPKELTSISSMSPYSSPLIVMFGMGEEFTTTTNIILRNLFLYEMCPEIEGILAAQSSGTIHAETIMEQDTDVLFIDRGYYESEDSMAIIETLQVPYVVVDFSTMKEQMEAALLVGEVLQKNEEAQQYVEYYQKTIDEISKIADTIPEEEYPNVYHAVNEATRTDYVGSMGADWLSVLNVNNVSLSGELDMQGGDAYTTLEAIYKWNPEKILCNESGVPEYILSDEKWTGLDAVLNEDVYQIPIGVTRYGHPNSIEIPLAIVYTAELLYPDYFEIDVEEEIQEFYQTFFDYDVTDEQIQDMIEADEIRTPRATSPEE